MYPHFFHTLILMTTLLILLATASATTNRVPGAWMRVNTRDRVLVEKGKVGCFGVQQECHKQVGFSKGGF